MAALIIALLEHSEHGAQVAGCLEQVGYEVVVVGSYPRAKAILQEHTFDLIISDVHLENGGSVFDFLKWVKSEPVLHSIPFVLLSVQPTKLAKYLADGVQTAARMFGAAKYITMEEFASADFVQQIGELLPPGRSTVSTIVTERGD
ncbi:MAG TPA: response regulator [Oculatellaceae cyanobacterium]